MNDLNTKTQRRTGAERRQTVARGMNAGLAQFAGAERRQMVAHGASRGSGVKKITSPGGA